jgi:hypothetical protein
MERGLEEGIRQTARAALAKGFSVGDVADITGLGKEAVEKLKSEGLM